MQFFPASGGTPIQWWERYSSQGESPRVSLEPDRSTAVRTVDTRWEDRWAFAENVIGSSQLGLSQNGKATIRRIDPWRFPRPAFGSGLGWLWASKISTSGVGKPSGECFDGNNNEAQAVYKYARHTITYETRTYDILSDTEYYSTYGQAMDESDLKRYITKVVRPQGEFLALDGNSYHYGGLVDARGDAQPLKRGISKPIISFNLSLTWHLIPYEAIPSKFHNAAGPNHAIDRTLGCVNNKAFAGWPIGTVLLTAASVDPVVSPLGQRYVNITYYFTVRNPSETVRGHPIHQNYVAGHQHVFSPKPPFGGEPGWYEFTTSKTVAESTTAPTNFIAKEDDVSLYRFRDFDMLFRPATYS